MRLSVLITTYGRRAYLERCLDSLLSQERRPDEIVIVTRQGDTDTENFVSGLLVTAPGPSLLRHARVDEPGVLPANRRGMEQITGDIVCFIDDDAAARPGWLGRIEKWFSSDPSLGAVGGQDVLHTEQGTVEEFTKTVGRISWYGRIVGNHHKKYTGFCYTEHLKGVNMSFRRELIQEFDSLILGNAHFYEMDLCFAVRRQGYRVLFDGNLIVDHYQDAPRFLPGSASGADAIREYFVHHNQVYVMMKNLSLFRQITFLIYSFIRDALTYTMKWAIGWRGTNAAIVIAVFKGKLAGLRDYLSSASDRRARAGRAARHSG